ncbi:hypothetical protein K1719_030783 [Acacia pycnantha]|nr:hypothetical protein K1719_030783 [Acacia pycnantha]
MYGLVLALKEVMPRALHRFCVQHVWKNFMKQWRDKQLRGLVWECARCTTILKFEKSMQKLKALYEAAWKYLANIDAGAWVKAYYSHWPKCDNITNNVSELTGLPCEHAIAAIAHKNELAENYVHQWLTMDALHATYEHTLNPVNSHDYWPSSDEPKPLPPQLKRPAGRPKKHRRKDLTEDQEKSTTKVKMTHVVKCLKCGQLGHYAKTYYAMSCLVSLLRLFLLLRLLHHMDAVI